jgi:N-acyl-phosphatidylethanolamine-hydrolysing phospholipase D
MTDPVLSPRASPVSFLGPRRASDPALVEHLLDGVDVVAISHDHYDHLDVETLRRIARRNACVAVVPRGVGELLRGLGFERIVELDWMDVCAIGAVSIRCLPAIHWSGRALERRNRRLWAGFAFHHGAAAIYFSGDTAYGPVFREIRASVGRFTHALVPIGGYAPRAIMGAHHASPEEAVAIATDLGATTLVAHHWGTYPLTHEPLHEPPERFRAAARARGYRDDDIWILDIGHPRSFAMTGRYSFDELLHA